MSPAAQILIVDDHELIREGLKRILLEAGAARRVAESGSAAEALALLRRERWSLVILDLNLPDRSGLELLRDVKALPAPPPVLILSIVPEDQVAVRVLRAGANGFLSKAVAAQDLVRAVECILGGGTHVSSAVAAKLVEGMRSSGTLQPHETLSEREEQVFRRIVAGQTVGEIAVALHLSAKTVSTYRTNTLRKLGLQNSAQLLSYAYQRGLNAAPE